MEERHNILMVANREVQAAVVTRQTVPLMDNVSERKIIPMVTLGLRNKEMRVVTVQGLCLVGGGVLFITVQVVAGVTVRLVHQLITVVVLVGRV